jgi:hypothetical protein
MGVLQLSKRFLKCVEEKVGVLSTEYERRSNL